MERAARRVFLSHTSELRDHPTGRSFVAAAEHAVNRARQSVTDMAYFTAREAKPGRYCEEQLERADVYVGIIGFRYGSLVRDDERGRSYVELEFDVATGKNLPRLVFLLDEEATVPLPRKYQSDPDHEAEQSAFRARVKDAGVIVGMVDSPAALETQLYQALIELPDQSVAEAPPEQPVGSGEIIDLYPLADLAQQQLQDVLALLERAEHAIDRVERRSTVKRPDGWSYADLKAIHEQRAASTADPAAELMTCSQQALGRVEVAGDYAGQLSARRFAAHVGDLGLIIDALSGLERMSTGLLARVAWSRDALQARIVQCRDYRIPQASLSSAYANLEEVRRQVTALKGSLETPLAETLHDVGAEQRQTGQAGPVSLETLTTVTAARAAPGGGKAAAGPPVQAIDEDAAPAWLPAGYTRQADIVAVKVQGDSMIGDDLRDGDYIILARGQDVKDGDMAVVRKGGENDTEALVKRVYYEEEALRLESSKPGQGPMRIGRDENPHIDGKVIGMFRPVI
jgi:SOS-response transcriptional repressor LexA